jgi:molybdopterin-dependent oxidoreductase alpha subunit
MDQLKVEEYANPAGGRGAVKGALSAFWQQRIPLRVIESFRKANTPHGFDCPGCAFPDRNQGGGVDSCEQGQKAIAWEMTPKCTDAEFFARNPLAALRGRTDQALESQGRLTTPMRYDASTDTYRPLGWSDAFDLIARKLKHMRPQEVAFYTSGRASNEASFLWQLLARSYGTAHLPDSSNLCHEPSGFAMKEMLGAGKGTCSLEDFEHAELIIVLGQNPASNHPRMMAALHAANRRGARIIALNPLAELGFRNFSDPKDLVEMLTNTGRKVAGRVYPVRIGGDLAALKGVMKVIVERNRQRAAAYSEIDLAFIGEHTLGFAEFEADLLAQPWDVLLAESGLARGDLEEIADLYVASNATMCTWCMGITHHENAHATIQTIVNLLLLRGNIGKPGAGAVPVRGHSNVQGNRTMGATGRVPPRFLDNLERVFDTAVQRQPGFDAVDTAKGVLDGRIRGFLALGGNYGVAAPDSPRLLDALGRCGLTVHVATKLNRTHLYPGETGLLLPSLGRTDIDARSDAVQLITVEDSMSMTHASGGIKTPISHEMMGEPAIVCGIGAALAEVASVGKGIRWRAFADDYAQIRDCIECCLDGVTQGFGDYNRKLERPGGFHLINHAALRQWRTPSGRAEFRVHPLPVDTHIQRARRSHPDLLTLMTIRSHDQFNTTVYSSNDRYRGIFGSRRVIFMNAADIAARDLRDGDSVDIEAIAGDGVERVVRGFRVVGYEIPVGNAAAYFPEATPLVSVNLVSTHTATPAYKEIPVVVSRSATQRKEHR